MAPRNPTMDELRLAQLLSQDISNNKKLEILKDLDVTCTVSAKSSSLQGNSAFLGYNCLHIAVINEHRRLKSEMDSLDLSLMQNMLNLGANLLQQDVQYGETPLHKAVDFIKNYSGISVWKLVGVLQEYRLVNTLLSAQVESDNPFNATCKNGVSHLHTACMFNHAEAVMLLARSKESLNQPINIDSNVLPGYTPLHCAIRYSSSESASTLLTLGANIYLENAEGMSSVCYLIERLLDANDYLNMTNSSHRYPYEKEIERLDSIVKVLVLKYRSDDSQLLENTGLSAFHLACMLKDNWIMQTYITWDFKNINKPATHKSKLWSGWTPLHFAACCNIQTLRVLLGNGANSNIKNAEGDTAFDLCLLRHSFEVTLPHLSIHAVLSDGSTKSSDLLLAMSKSNFSEFLHELKDINTTVPLESPRWPGYNLLHMAISLYHTKKSLYAFHRETDYCPKTGYAVSLPQNHERRCPSHLPRIEDILKRDCSIYAKNADGLTPIHLALKLDEWHVVEKLLTHAQENIVGPDNVSLLHIACAMGNITTVEILLEKGADVNSPVTSSLEWHAKPKFLFEMNHRSKLRRVLVRRGSTPLHIAVMFETEKVIEKLLKRHADVHATDELGSTPLHSSLVSSTTKIARLLLRGASSLRDVRREDGLSHLHVAAFVNDEQAARKLLQAGADANCLVGNSVPKYFSAFVGQTPLHLALMKCAGKAALVLIENGANILAENPNCNYETPLDLAMRSSGSSVVFEKIKSSEQGRIDALTVSGVTALHIACVTWDLDWTRELLRRGANPNSQMKDTQGRVDTPMHLVLRSVACCVHLIELLLEYGADVTISSNGKTPLHLVADIYFGSNLPALDNSTLFAIVDLLLINQRSYVFNPTDADGFSHFHIACMTNNLDVMKMYLDNGIDVNSSKCPFASGNGGYTPLHFAIAHKSMDAVRLLLKNGADVKAVNTNGNTLFHMTITMGIIDFQLFDVLLKKGADINAKNLKDLTPIRCLLCYKYVTHREFHFFMNRGSSIDLSEGIFDGQGIIGFALENTIPSDVGSVLETLIRFSHVKDAIDRGFMAIHNLVSVRQSKNLTCEHYLNAMERLTENGSDIDQQDEHGKRALDIAISFHNLSAIEALLLLGADVNVIEDEDGSSSVAKSCQSSSWGGKSVPFMRNHLWKMSLVKLDLNASSIKAVKREGWKPTDNDVQVYQTELQEIELTKIYQSLTVKHFLSEWGAVMEYPTMSVAKRQAVDNFFKCTDDLRLVFPEFAGILTMQFRKALVRVKLMQPVKGILVAAGIDLPDLCLEAILKYFKNYELKFWIENAEENNKI